MGTIARRLTLAPPVHGGLKAFALLSDGGAIVFTTS
jgi:hypothetical protein